MGKLRWKQTNWKLTCKKEIEKSRKSAKSLSNKETEKLRLDKESLKKKLNEVMPKPFPKLHLVERGSRKFPIPVEAGKTAEAFWLMDQPNYSADPETSWLYAEEKIRPTKCPFDARWLKTRSMCVWDDKRHKPHGTPAPTAPEPTMTTDKVAQWKRGRFLFRQVVQETVRRDDVSYEPFGNGD